MTSGKKTETASWRNWRTVGPLLFAGHLAILTALCGFNVEYVIVDGFFLALTLCGAKARQFAWLGLPIWIAAVVYANILPLLLPFRGPVHVADLYAAELHWFGIPGPHGRQTLCEFFRDHHWAAVDVILRAGISVLSARDIAIWSLLVLQGSAAFGSIGLGVCDRPHRQLRDLRLLSSGAAVVC